MAYHGYEPAKVAVEVGDGSITTAKIDADAVTNAKIADNAVDTEHLADDAIEAAELASDAVVNASVASGAAIATSKISGALTSIGSHGLGSLATLSTVAAATITDDSVGADELNVSGDGTTSQFLRSDGDGTFSWVAPSGVALTGSTDNQVVTVTGADAIAGESGLTFDGNTLDISYGGTSSAHAIVGGANDGSNTRTNATNKYFQMGMANYENAEELEIQQLLCL